MDLQQKFLYFITHIVFVHMYLFILYVVIYIDLVLALSQIYVVIRRLTAYVEIILDISIMNPCKTRLHA